MNAPTLDAAFVAGPVQPGLLRSADTPLGLARVARGWSQEKTVRALILLARSWGWQVASKSSLKVQLSCWEHGRRRPNESYRLLLCTVYRATAEELGFDRLAGEASVRTLRQRINDLERLVASLTLTTPDARGVSA
ncbi:XRE family transcriptional regulator [Streptomyces cavourensis]|uniref:XRE family transcriptional regulator n=1 Tax=Streptomyces cavourensis TaxID=67258 RepID=UPI0022785221|nr:XRE family transcriptional regulator [Streptomyces cavourensis]WAE68463.1 XRE family transcriptional regulator [Streptomyces cavourensis]